MRKFAHLPNIESTDPLYPASVTAHHAASTLTSSGCGDFIFFPHLAAYPLATSECLSENVDIVPHSHGGTVLSKKINRGLLVSSNARYTTRYIPPLSLKCHFAVDWSESGFKQDPNVTCGALCLVSFSVESRPFLPFDSMLSTS